MKKYNPGGELMSTRNVTKKQREQDLKALALAKSLGRPVYFIPKGDSSEFKKKGIETLTLKKIKPNDN